MFVEAIAMGAAGLAAAGLGYAGGRVFATSQQRRRSDILTGLRNRRAFDHDAARLVDGSRQMTGDLCILMFDIDGLGGIDARFGRGFGDFVLRLFAQKASAELRENDTLFRIGGDEFCCLLPMTCAESAEAIATRIMAAFGEKKLRARKKQNVRPTVAVGLASSADFGFAFEGLRSAAIEAMGDAKAAGGNRLVRARQPYAELLAA